MMQKEECKVVEQVSKEPPMPMEESVPMDVEPSVVEAAAVPAQKPAPMEVAATTETTPKKKKKSSYKDVMSGMIKTTSPADAKEKQKEQLRKVTGGGAFTKIDKI